MAELIDKGALVNSLQNDINMTIEFMNNNGTDKYDGSFDRMFGQLNTLKSYKSIVSDMPTVTEADIREKAIEEFAEKLREFCKTHEVSADKVRQLVYKRDGEWQWYDLIADLAEQLKGE